MNPITIIRCLCIISSLTLLIRPSVASPESNALDFPSVLQKVFQNDYQLARFTIEAKSFNAEAESKNVLPDPIFFAAMQNLPTDTFDLDQEGMTQLRVGLRQMFPKGDTLALSKNIVLHQQTQQYIQQKQRVLDLRQQTEMAWLEAWYWQKNMQLVEEDRTFLTQMLDFTRSIYQIGGNNQSDVLGAELELIKLDETLLEADRHFQIYRRELDTLANEALISSQLADNLIALPVNELPSETALYKVLSAHPEFLFLDENVAQLSDSLALSEQDYKPQWGVELSYGYRQDMPNGNDRADLLTAGLSVQVPLFSRTQKMQSVRSIKYKQASVENRRLELFQKVRFELENLSQQYATTLAQVNLYQSQFLPTLMKQKNSALQSYESNKGDFRSVIDLYLKYQTSRIMHQRLLVNAQKLLSKMNYWLRKDSNIQVSRIAHMLGQENQQ